MLPPAGPAIPNSALPSRYEIRRVPRGGLPLRYGSSTVHGLQSLRRILAARDPRHPTISTVYVGRASGAPAGGDDAAEARLFGEDDLPSPLAFDHAKILADYFRFKKTGRRPL